MRPETYFAKRRKYRRSELEAAIVQEMQLGIGEFGRIHPRVAAFAAVLATRKMFGARREDWPDGVAHDAEAIGRHQMNLINDRARA